MEFAKMHGTGNDFVLIDGRKQERDWAKLAAALCDRHFGVGGDGILVVSPSRVADFRMRMFNPDGSEAEMCGNGIRCFTKYVLDEGLARGDTLKVETLAGVHKLTAQRNASGVTSVRVGMGRPRLKPAEIPVAASGEGRVMDHPIQVDGKTIAVTCVSMGNPHAVAFLKEPVGEWPLNVIGPGVERHPFFPKRVNFEIVNTVDRGHLVARVWERGAGLTLACGTGACAIGVAARLHNLTDETVRITLPGGDLTVQWDGVPDPLTTFPAREGETTGEVWLEGPAELVFKGVWPEQAA